MKEWKDLTIAEKVPYLKLGIDNGILDINTVINTYNSFANGGKADNYDDVELKEVVIKPTARQKALVKSRKAQAPNTDFMHAQDMNKMQRIRATYLQSIPDFILRHPHTCLNTVTSFYNPNSTVATNTSIWNNPTAYGYKQIPQTEAQAGDLIILSNRENHPVHAVMFDGVAAENGDYKGYPYTAGDTLVNYSNGGLNKEDYKVQSPLKRFDDRENAGGDFSGKRRYYKYIGK